MGFYTTDERAAVLEPCQENLIPPSKNRVWNFFTTSETCTGFSESQPVESHWEKWPTPTKTVSGVRYYGYRYYAPNLGRWLSRDPIGEYGGLNLYGYVENDPVNGIDPFGLWHGGDHERMTRGAWNGVTMAAEEWPYRDEMADVLVDANAYVDSHWLSDNAWHFNRDLVNGRSSNANVDAAKTAYADNLSANQTKVQNDLATPNKVNCVDALKVMGNLSHAYQDYYAHAILMTSDGTRGTIGRVTGNPGAPGADMKPASWGSIWHRGEHGASEPGSRAPDTASRKSQAQTYTEMEFQVFSANWWHACKCYAKDIFGH